MYTLSLNDYGERTCSAMECERACNPVIDGYVALRVLQVLQGIFLGSYTVTLIHLVLAVATIVLIQRGHLYIDATTVWRQVTKYEQTGYVILGVDIVIFVVLIIVMVFSLVLKYEH
uniref:ER-derived vesicles protein erv14 n=1 Tax=Lygus hesperus TaxID=30085 RepID=A0A0A9WRH3_LYGHE